MRVVPREAAVDNLAVDGDGISLQRDGVLRRGDDGAVDGDATGEDERLGRAAGRDAESRERFGKANALGVLSLALLGGEGVLARGSLLGLARADALRGRGGDRARGVREEAPAPAPAAPAAVGRGTRARDDGGVDVAARSGRP